MKKVAIIGGGPSGTFLAYKLLEYSDDFEITIFEKGKTLSTILVTGSGRCNLSYKEDDFKLYAANYPRGEKFLYSIFSRYFLYDTLDDFKKLGVETYVQDDFRIFPTTNKSSDIRNAILDKIKDRVKIIKKEVNEVLDGFDYTVLATGLKFGASLAKKYGHTIVPLKPSLCGLKIKEREFLSLEGVSYNGVIFTKYGVSGPFIYKLSSINSRCEFPYEINIPLINVDELKTFVKDNPKKLFKNAVSNFIPKSLADVLIKSDKQCANTTNKEIESLTCLKLTATDYDGKGEVVHSGGVDLSEVDKNLKSKIVPNLWIIGELLDIDGFSGGFNLQNCWSTASIAALDITKQ